MKFQLIDCLKSALNQANIPSNGTTILVAVSGGEDSMCLLHALVYLKNDYQLQLNIAHVNHGLRPDANHDQNLVEVTAKKYNLPVYTHALNKNKKAKNENQESWARDERYRYLKQIGDQISADWILTAHHGNDQIETLLQRLLTGAGSQGMRGIHTRSGKILRPLLHCSKDDIHSYQVYHQVEFRHDSSNNDNTLTRNYLRNIIIPQLEDHFSQVSANAQRTAEAMADVEKVVGRALSNFEHSLESAIENEHRLVFPSKSLPECPTLVTGTILAEGLCYAGNTSIRGMVKN